MLQTSRNSIKWRQAASSTTTVSWRKRPHPSARKLHHSHNSLAARPESLFTQRRIGSRYYHDVVRPFSTQQRGLSTVSYDFDHSTSTTVSSRQHQMDIEEFTLKSMAELMPQRIHNLHHPRSLELELGEVNVWDDCGLLDQDFEDDDPFDPEEIGNASNEQVSRRSIQDLLLHFDPENPPSSVEDLELWLECEAHSESVLKYQKMVQAARDRKDYTSLSFVQKQVLRWFHPVSECIAQRQKQYVSGEKTTKSISRLGPYLCSLSAEKLALITAHETILATITNQTSSFVKSLPFVTLTTRIGSAVENEVLIQAALQKRMNEASKKADHSVQENLKDLLEETFEPTESPDAGEGSAVRSPELQPRWEYTPSHLNRFLEEIKRNRPNAKRMQVISQAIRRARQITDSDEPWTAAEKVQVGAALFQALLQNATLEIEGSEEMAFSYEKRWIQKNKIQSVVSLNEQLYNMIVNDKFEFISTIPTVHKPMVVPPSSWTGVRNGGYQWLKVDMMRFHGCNIQKEVLQNADLKTVYEGLNALAQVPWKINKRLLRVAQQCWESNIALGDIPSQTDFDVPDEPIPPEQFYDKLDREGPAYEEQLQSFKSYRESLNKRNRIVQKNMDLHSLRCSARLKLDQAKKFQEFDRIYFPYNIDFRGRAYPVPPHLSNVGSDLSRGVLMFAEEKPLGKRGLHWLKVHLANFAGKDKMTFEERAQFVDENMDKVRRSAEDPFGDDRWWMSLEDPFQGLAACIEIIRAIDSGDPESYMCSLAVHMDGSCNGLQHYAALGRDRGGGKAVNLCDFDEPQDVYLGVMHEVIRRVSEEAERDVPFGTSNFNSLTTKEKRQLRNNRSAKLVNGLIDRGVVKRTVMTSVYGVTYVGARQQIQEKIEEKLEAEGRDVDEISDEVFHACGYLATVTMDAIGDLFQGAKGTMNWLTTCAQLIAQQGYPVAWFSPVGLPAIQPYRQKRSATVVTLMQTVTLVDDNDNLPIHRSRQVSAFPPNFVHSLDSSHMLLTALEMERRGLTFSAVHDSFWTHPCDVDEMNEALREVFVKMYSTPLLEELKQDWEMRYPSVEFPPIPPKGDLDLEEVKKAKYFFQ